MKSCVLPMLAKALLLGTLLATVQACSYAPTATEVAQAYESSGIAGLSHPYTRTIFSSSNF